MESFSALLALAGGFLLGSIPFGLLLVRLFGMGDVRRIGSGNIGATNVLRTGKKGVAALTLLLDAGKGALAVLLARHFGGEGLALAAGGGAILGHVYSPWLGFHGGKGVATLLGVTLAVLPWAGLGFGVGWLAAVVLTRISSVGGMAAGFAAAATAFFVGAPTDALFLLLFALFLLWTHRANLARLVAHTEPRIGGRKE